MGDWEDRLHKPVIHLADQLKGIRSGTIDAGFVETFRISWQGRAEPIGRLATIARQQGRIVVTPFERSMVPAVVKALVEARQNAYALDPDRIAVSVPPISGEQRAEIARHVKTLGEQAKVGIRSTRQEIRKRLAAAGKRSERVVQEITDAAIARVDELIRKKLEELGA